MYTTQGHTGVALRRKVTEQRPAGAGIIVTRGWEDPGFHWECVLRLSEKFHGLARK